MIRYNFYIATVIETGESDYHFDSFFAVVIQPMPNVPIVDQIVIVYAMTNDLDFPNITDTDVRRQFKQQFKATIPLQSEGIDEIKAVENAIKSIYSKPSTIVIKQYYNS